MATTVTDLSGIQPNSPESQAITRQREMAKLLTQQGLKPDAGRMVGQHYVANPWGNIANLFSAYQGKKLAEEADTKQTAMAEALRKQNAIDLENYGKARYGYQQDVTRPQAGPMQTDEENNPIPLGNFTQRETFAANPVEAMRIASQSRNPILQNMIADEFKLQKLAPDETLLRINPFTGQQENMAVGSPKGTDDINEYNYAVKNGYKGSFVDWMLLKQNAQQANRPLGNADQRIVDKYNMLDSNFERIDNIKKDLTNPNLNLGGGIWGKTQQYFGSQLGTDASQQTKLVLEEISKAILPQVKLLGANPSNADREYVTKNIPDVGWSRERITEWLTRAQRAIEFEQNAILKTSSPLVRDRLSQTPPRQVPAVPAATPAAPAAPNTPPGGAGNAPNKTVDFNALPKGKP